MSKLEDRPATIGDLREMADLILTVLAPRDPSRAGRRMRLELIVGSAKRRTKPRGQLHLVRGAS